MVNIKIRLGVAYFLAIIAGMAMTSSVGAQQADEQWPDSIWSRPALLDGPGSPKETLRAHGIAVDAWLTQFYQGFESGDADKEWQYGGKGDLIATFDAAKFGLWQGLFVKVHQEWLYGEDANTRGGLLIPVNTAMAFPRLGGHESDTSIVVTQNFSDAASLSLGKFNMIVDVASRTPLLGGGGIDTFMNLGLAAPISGVTPPYLLGGMFTLKTQPAIFTLMIYDPRNAQDWQVIEHPFEEGVTTSFFVTVPTKIAGLSGYYGARALYSTEEGLDLATIPQLGLPPQSSAILTKAGYWFFSSSFQQYLVQNPTNANEGWGLFGQVAISDGNPNPVKWSALAGVGGTSFIPGRNLDRWGIGYFHYGLSSVLLDGLAQLGIDRNDEQGLEAYYNLAITPWSFLTADLQWIDPYQTGSGNAIVAALRTQTKF